MNVHTDLPQVAALRLEVERRLGKSYQEVYQRMKKVRMIDDYIIPCYDALHTQSRERVTDDMIEYLNNKEALQ